MTKNANLLTDVLILHPTRLGLDCSHTFQVYLHQISARSDQYFDAQLTSKMDFRSKSRTITEQPLLISNTTNEEVSCAAQV